ncbi:MAG: rhodanese-like domain-containing protein [Panacagrimonas sp.]
MAITKSVASLVTAANQQIQTLSVQQAAALLGDPDVVFVDIRDIRELYRDGKVEGAFHAPRGMLEFWVDPQSPYHKPLFADESKRFVLYCGGGWRSALATLALKDMGMSNVCHFDGGFKAWKESGGAIEAVKATPRPS